MDIETVHHVKELRRNSYKRLCILELKAAQQGIDTPPHILMEIDELREKLVDLDNQLSDLQKLPTNIANGVSKQPQNNSSLNKQKVEVIFRGDFSSLTPDLQLATIRAIAALVDISPEEVTILRVAQGSIAFLLELPGESAKILMKLYESADPVLEDIGILHVTFPSLRTNEKKVSRSATMSGQDYRLEDRIKLLEHEVETLKHALGNFAVGLDKVSQIQANQTGAIEELTQASAAQVKYLKKLDGNTNKTNQLLSDVLNKLLPK